MMEKDIFEQLTYILQKLHQKSWVSVLVGIRSLETTKKNPRLKFTLLTGIPQAMHFHLDPVVNSQTIILLIVHHVSLHSVQ